MQQHAVTFEEFMDFFDERTVGLSDSEKEEVLRRFLQGMEEDEGLTSRPPWKVRPAQGVRVR
jgi:hypothetical protein